MQRSHRWESSGWWDRIPDQESIAGWTIPIYGGGAEVVKNMTLALISPKNLTLAHVRDATKHRLGQG